MTRLSFGFVTEFRTRFLNVNEAGRGLTVFVRTGPVNQFTPATVFTAV